MAKKKEKKNSLRTPSSHLQEKSSLQSVGGAADGTLPWLLGTLWVLLHFENPRLVALEGDLWLGLEWKETVWEVMLDAQKGARERVENGRKPLRSTAQ